jgi:hypothetical protein
MNKVNCELLPLLHLAQLDPNLLTDAEWAALEAHLLEAGHPCPICSSDLQSFKEALMVEMPELSCDTTQQSEALAGRSTAQPITEQVVNAFAFVIKCLAGCEAPSREALALGPSGFVVDAIKEIMIPERLQAALPWLGQKRLEVYRVGEANGEVRYGVRVFPRVANANQTGRLLVTLRASDDKNATTVLTSRRTARNFDGDFPADWSELSLEVCAEDEHGRNLSIT